MLLSSLLAGRLLHRALAPAASLLQMPPAPSAFATAAGFSFRGSGIIPAGLRLSGRPSNGRPLVPRRAIHASRVVGHTQAEASSYVRFIEQAMSESDKHKQADELAVAIAQAGEFGQRQVLEAVKRLEERLDTNVKSLEERLDTNVKSLDKRLDTNNTNVKSLDNKLWAIISLVATAFLGVLGLIVALLSTILSRNGSAPPSGPSMAPPAAAAAVPGTMPLASYPVASPPSASPTTTLPLAASQPAAHPPASSMPAASLPATSSPAVAPAPPTPATPVQ
eukprot:tig00000144_g8993.t1